jgi:hypothetical protein
MKKMLSLTCLLCVSTGEEGLKRMDIKKNGIFSLEEHAKTN